MTGSRVRTEGYSVVVHKAIKVQTSDNDLQRCQEYLTSDNGRVVFVAHANGQIAPFSRFPPNFPCKFRDGRLSRGRQSAADRIGSTTDTL